MRFGHAYIFAAVSPQLAFLGCAGGLTAGVMFYLFEVGSDGAAECHMAL